MSHAAQSSLLSYVVGRYGLDLDAYDPRDPRGQLLVWEPPSPHYSYVVGCDPTMGILGWSRQTRSDQDDKHDNAAIEVFRQGGYRWDDTAQQHVKQPDVQVAEWAGPLDAEDLAYVLNFIGRMYAGNSEESQALMCIEVYPGPGWLTQRVLISQFGYERFPPWLVEGRNLLMQDTGLRGWVSNASTRRDLWVRGAGHIKRRRVILHSPHFVEEMVACTPDNFLALTARAARSGQSRVNDDRVVAGLIALWFCNEWQVGQEPTEPTGPAQSQSAADWQLSDISYEDMKESWDARVGELQD